MGVRKKLGVIGGMGPEASSYFYQELTAATAASSDQEHIDALILSHATMPDRTRAIATGDSRALIDAMGADMRLLEAWGAANVAIPCNTSHYFYDQIQAAAPVPVIHMPRETVRYAVERGLGDTARASGARRIGIMATDGTVMAGVYAHECAALGVEAVTPSPDRQRDVMVLIYDEIKAGRPADEARFARVIDELVGEKGCQTVILACTELSVYKRDHTVPACCLDALDVLVREAVLRSGAPYCGPLG